MTRAARAYLDEWIADLFSGTRATCQDTLAEFKHAFHKATRFVESSDFDESDIIGELAKQDYERIFNILTRLDAGESLESIYAKAEARDAEFHKKRAAELSVELQDRLSAEWRHWKIRQFEEALNGADHDAIGEAWEEFRRLLRGMMHVDAWDFEEAVSIYTQLLIMREKLSDKNRAILESYEQADEPDAEPYVMGFTEYIIAALEHPKVPEATKEAISAILVNHLSNAAGSWMEPPILRVYLPYMLTNVNEQFADGLIVAMREVVDSQVDGDVRGELFRLYSGNGKLRAPRSDDAPDQTRQLEAETEGGASDGK